MKIDATIYRAFRSLDEKKKELKFEKNLSTSSENRHISAQKLNTTPTVSSSLSTSLQRAITLSGADISSDPQPEIKTSRSIQGEIDNSKPILEKRTEDFIRRGQNTAELGNSLLALESHPVKASQAYFPLSSHVLAADTTQVAYSKDLTQEDLDQIRRATATIAEEEILKSIMYLL